MRGYRSDNEHVDGEESELTQPRTDDESRDEVLPVLLPWSTFALRVQDHHARHDRHVDKNRPASPSEDSRPDLNADGDDECGDSDGNEADSGIEGGAIEGFLPEEWHRVSGCSPEHERGQTECRDIVSIEVLAEVKCTWEDLH
ncbi:hypothetical protein CPI04_06005, partial [Moraxella catarrhalis]|nr:hypothetical protein [Moraxella catarrhalis]